MNRKFRTIAVAVLLMGVASLVGGCKKGKVVNVTPSKKIVEVGETTTVSCTFNKGKEVDWSVSPHDIVESNRFRGQQMDEINIIGLKEGSCLVTATGRKGTVDECVVEVNTFIRPEGVISLKSEDSTRITTRSGHNLRMKVENEFYCDLLFDSINFIPKMIQHQNEYYDHGTLVSNLEIKMVNLTETTAYVLAKHVGETYIRLFDTETEGSEVNTGLVVKVLPRYNDYIGILDFNDTQDSVRMKIGTIYTEDYTESGDLEWIYLNYPNTYLLNIVYYQNYNLIKTYGMAYSNEEIQTEVMASIKERYAYVSTSQGIDIFTNADYTTVVGVQSWNGYLIVSVVPNYSKDFGEGCINEVAKNMQILINAVK